MPSAEYLTVVISVVTIIISVGISYGIMKTEIRTVKEKQEKYDKDHDLLVEVNTKIDMLLSKQRSKK